ncbi:MAG: tRNA pseudouridine(55) synthase TruB [bacterium]|nr:tRNA pseudouridine(55) synthase TruB [bacterium]
MNGLLVINKEKNLTSRDVVNIVCKKLNTKKVGHTGTLDPIATGVLVLAIGNALKIVDEITHEQKEYIATVRMGIETDTLDVTGNILKEQKFDRPSKEVLKKTLKTFIGKSIQEVPLYSAVKVNGKRLYEYARNNISVELPKREIEIFNIELLEYNRYEFTFKAFVSKGTYIRSLIRDIGNKLNILCSMKELKRTKQGMFNIEDSYTLEDVLNNNYKIISMIDYLNNYEKVIVDLFLEKKIRNGRILENRYKTSKIAFINQKKELLALYKTFEKDNSKIKPCKVFVNNK